MDNKLIEEDDIKINLQRDSMPKFDDVQNIKLEEEDLFEVENKQFSFKNLNKKEKVSLIVFSISMLVSIISLIIFFATRKKEFNNKNIKAKIREIGQEAIILLENKNNILPIKSNQIVSVFGRNSYELFSTGHDSGVNAAYKKNIIDGLKENKQKINVALQISYDTWIKQNKIKKEEFSYPERQNINELIEKSALHSDVALITIGRLGESGKDLPLKEGGYYLTQNEISLIDNVTKYFKQQNKKIILIINSGTIIDFSFYEEKYKDKLDALVVNFYSGMEAGNAIADVLLGKANPSGKLPLTIAKNYFDYPGSENYTYNDYLNYTENIYIGYRYFLTFNKEKILYNFGYGLSYSKFEYEKPQVIIKENYTFIISVKVKNLGPYEGKEIIQVYVTFPSYDYLDNPIKMLCGINKTKILKVNESEEIQIFVDLKEFSNYNENYSAYVLLDGFYSFELNKHSGESNKIFSFQKPSSEIIKKVDRHLSFIPQDFDYLVNHNGEKMFKKTISYDSQIKVEIAKNLPQNMPIQEKDIKFTEVLEHQITIKEFISSLSLEELNDLVHGEGVKNSKNGISGNEGILGGVTEALRKNKAIPVMSFHNGSSGISITKSASVLPSGLALAASFNLELIYDLYKELAYELTFNNVDVLLAPGMNLIRNPLNGRNFEYFGEDPFLTGKIASKIINGIQYDNNHSACPKYFALYNRELNKGNVDIRITERALREIYLKSFEIAIKEGNPKLIMTSSNKINGVFSYYNYELITSILRNEMGFAGLVIANEEIKNGQSKEFHNVTNDAYRIRTQTDAILPGKIGSDSQNERNIINSAINRDIRIGEVQRSVFNVLRLIYDIKKSK